MSTVQNATIANGIYREIYTTAGCALADTCVGQLRIRVAGTEVDLHLHEAERVALIEALGGKVEE